jgi:citrate lyase subunit beta/citryl-CoA lyase
MSIVPRRSVLYMPANNVRALEKARSLPADCIVIDLEDAVAPSAKVDARQQAIAAIQAGGFGKREVVVRINAVGTPWFEDDLAAMITHEVAIVALPKVEDANTVVTVASRLPVTSQLWAMIETPRGVTNVEAIAAAHRRLGVLVMGTSDLAKELRVPHTPERLGLLYALERCVCAARLAGLDIIDGVHLNFKDLVEFEMLCQQGRHLGFDGKSLIHPSQIEAANRTFAPSADEVERAGRIVTAWRAVESAGLGVAVLDGKLIENLHAAEAERILLLADAIAANDACDN